MAGNPTGGAKHFIAGFGLMLKPGVKRYVFFPLLINILVFAAAIAGLAHYFDQLNAWMMDFLPDWEWLAWLTKLLWLLFTLALALVVFYTFTIIANIIAAPFNSFLADKVQEHLTGKPGCVDETLSQEVVRSIRSELIKLMYMISRVVPAAIVLAILSFIPLVNTLTPILWFLLSAWLLSLEYTDYSTGNNGGQFSDTKALAKAHRGDALGFGALVTLATSIPILNLFVMPAAVAGGTAFWVEKQAK